MEISNRSLSYKYACDCRSTFTHIYTYTPSEFCWIIAFLVVLLNFYSYKKKRKNYFVFVTFAFFSSFMLSLCWHTWRVCKHYQNRKQKCVMEIRQYRLILTKLTLWHLIRGGVWENERKFSLSGKLYKSHVSMPILTSKIIEFDH